MPWKTLLACRMTVCRCGPVRRGPGVTCQPRTPRDASTALPTRLEAGGSHSPRSPSPPHRGRSHLRESGASGGPSQDWREIPIGHASTEALPRRETQPQAARKRKSHSASPNVFGKEGERDYVNVPIKEIERIILNRYKAVGEAQVPFARFSQLRTSACLNVEYPDA